ncbi:hypothetical protein, partial [Prevotella pallens]|uniref:hypothetical protein n=1 Tax=Prevotella pallens TaxID=60133 RepID=UPI0023F38BD8
FCCVYILLYLFRRELYLSNCSDLSSFANLLESNNRRLYGRDESAPTPCGMFAVIDLRTE